MDIKVRRLYRRQFGEGAQPQVKVDAQGDTWKEQIGGKVKVGSEEGGLPDRRSMIPELCGGGNWFNTNRVAYTKNLPIST